MQLILKIFTSLVVLNFYAQCDTLPEPTVTVATLLEDPYTTLRDATLTGNDRFEGFIIDLVDRLAKKLSFKYDVRIVEDGRYGSFNGVNKEWNGLIGEVKSGLATIGAAPITITSERERAVDFTLPFMSVGISVLYKRPSDGKVLPFTNVEELAALETTEIGCVMGGATYNFFKNSDNPTYKRIYERMVSVEPSTLARTVIEGIERVKTEDYAFFMESSSLEYVIERNCDLVQVGGLLNSRGFGLVVQDGSPLRAQLTEAILELQETGDLTKLKDKWWRNKNGERCHH